jgi:hypothetical protein
LDENHRNSPNLLATFCHGKSLALILPKNICLATFLAIFSQTHLVTLVSFHTAVSKSQNVNHRSLETRKND